MLQINKVFEFSGELYRILSVIEKNVWWIKIFSDKALPEMITLLELEEHYSKSKLIDANDPYIGGASNVSDAAIASRDKSYALIESMIRTENVFYPTLRSQLINEIIKNKGSTKRTIYRLLRAYWQKGQSKDALIPRFGERGGGGALRTNINKPGRKPLYSESEGTALNENIEKIFQRVIHQYLLVKKPVSQKDAYLKFMNYFSESFPNIEPENYPTLRQFTYYYQRNYRAETRLKSQTSLVNYQKDHRSLRSTATAQTIGPGSRYEIDATIADIYLVSENHRHDIIGRPTIYFVIDVFSRMVVGMYIGYDNPSYVVAMQAIVTACTNKEKLCAQAGIDIDESEWPVCGLPDAILADRGELLGHQIEALTLGFGVRIENAPPRRGDAKGIVERAFRTVQDKFKPYLPGVVEGTRIKKHGESDYRTEAKMTVEEFTQIILKIVIHHNNYKQIPTYDPDEYMPPDIPRIPKHIWNWGIQNKTGMLRAADSEYLRIAMLPRKSATLSERGLKVWGVEYISSEIIKEGWLVRYSGHIRPQGLEVAYDPDNADFVYLFTDSSKRSYWRCQITDRCRRFRGMTFWKVWELQYLEKTTQKNYQLREYQKQAELNEFIEATKKKAEKESSSLDIDESNQKRIKNIKDNKANAINQERSLRGKLERTNKTKADVISLRGEEDDYDYPSFVPSLFDDDPES